MVPLGSVMRGGTWAALSFKRNISAAASALLPGAMDFHPPIGHGTAVETARIRDL